MKYCVLAAFVLVIAGVMIAGCTQSQGTATTATPAAPSVTAAVTAAAAATTAQPSFTLGDHYLKKSQGYTFQTEKDVIVEEFRADTASWGIYFKVQPLSDDTQKCWFTMDVTDANTQKNLTYGYGKDQPYESEQWIAMYGADPYKMTMTGNCVKVWVTAAKRIP